MQEGWTDRDKMNKWMDGRTDGLTRTFGRRDGRMDGNALPCNTAIISNN